MALRDDGARVAYQPPQEGGFKGARFSAMSMTREHAWQTPPGLFADLHAEFRFTIDLAATAENALLPRFYTEADNALLQDWSHERGFCNPPYDRRRQPLFIEKASIESARGALVVMLLPVRTDTVIWQEVIFPHAADIRFLRGRLRFKMMGGQHGAPFPSAIVVFGAA